MKFFIKNVKQLCIYRRECGIFDLCYDSPSVASGFIGSLAMASLFVGIVPRQGLVESAYNFLKRHDADDGHDIRDDIPSNRISVRLVARRTGFSHEYGQQ